jgi:hypothetical protein
MAAALDIKEDFNILQGFFKDNNQEGINSIYDKYGGQEKFEQAIINYDTANEAPPGTEERVSTEEVLAQMDKQEDISTSQAGGQTIFQDLERFKDAEKQFQDYEEKLAVADNIINIAGLTEDQGDALKKSLGLNTKGIMGTLKEVASGFGELFTGRTNVDLENLQAAGKVAGALPMTGNQAGTLYQTAFSEDTGRDVFTERLTDPRTQFFLRLAKESGTPSFDSPFARVANAALQTGEAEQQKLLNLLRYGQKNKTTGPKYETKQIRYTIEENDPYFSELGFSAGTPGYATVQLKDGKIDEYLDFALSTQKVPADSFDPSKYPYIEEEDKRIVGIDLNELTKQKDLLSENVRLASSIERGPEGITNADRLLSPVVEFVSTKSPRLAEAMADIAGRDIKDYSIFKDMEANVFDLLLNDLKNLYPVSDNDMNVIKASKPLGAFGFGLRSSQLLSFKEYDILQNQAERDFINKNFQLNQMPTSASPKGIEFNGKTYYSAANYAKAVVESQVNQAFKESGVTEDQMKTWGFQKEKGDYNVFTKLMVMNGMDVAKQFNQDPAKIFLSKSDAATNLLESLNLTQDPEDLTDAQALAIANDEKKRRTIITQNLDENSAEYRKWTEKYPGLDINESILSQLYPNYNF